MRKLVSISSQRLQLDFTLRYYIVVSREYSESAAIESLSRYFDVTLDLSALRPVKSNTRIKALCSPVSGSYDRPMFNMARLLLFYLFTLTGAFAGLYFNENEPCYKKQPRRNLQGIKYVCQTLVLFTVLTLLLYDLLTT